MTPAGRWWVPLKGCRRWAFGAVPLGAEAMETRLRAQLAWGKGLGPRKAAVILVNESALAVVSHISPLANQYGYQ